MDRETFAATQELQPEQLNSAEAFLGDPEAIRAAREAVDSVFNPATVGRGALDSIQTPPSVEKHTDKTLEILAWVQAASRNIVAMRSAAAREDYTLAT